MHLSLQYCFALANTSIGMILSRSNKAFEYFLASLFSAKTVKRFLNTPIALLTTGAIAPKTCGIIVPIFLNTASARAPALLIMSLNVGKLFLANPSFRLVIISATPRVTAVLAFEIDVLIPLVESLAIWFSDLRVVAVANHCLLV